MSSLQVVLIPRTSQCMKHAFNGSIVVMTDKNDFDTVFESSGPFKLINFYRNSMTPGSPCNISCKELIIDDRTTMEGSNIIVNAKFIKHFTTDDYKEDPRCVMVSSQQLLLSFNEVTFEDDETISRVRVKYCTVEPDGATGSIVLSNLSTMSQLSHGLRKSSGKSDSSDCIQLAKWEKNWMILSRDESQEQHTIYTIYPQLVVVDSIGRIIHRHQWLHPQYISSYVTNPMIFHWKNARSFRGMRYTQKLPFSTHPPIEIRGGAHPVYYDEHWWLFAHTRENTGNTYQMIVVVLTPSLTVKACSNPIKVPGYEDARIIYPMGAVFNRTVNKWYVSCGLNDIDQLILAIPHEWLKSQLLTV